MKSRKFISCRKAAVAASLTRVWVARQIVRFRSRRGFHKRMREQSAARAIKLRRRSVTRHAYPKFLSYLKFPVRNQNFEAGNAASWLRLVLQVPAHNKHCGGNVTLAKLLFPAVSATKLQLMSYLSLLSLVLVRIHPTGSGGDHWPGTGSRWKSKSRTASNYGPMRFWSARFRRQQPFLPVPVC